MPIPPTCVILAAAGAGRRLRSGRPKALLPVAGKPLFFHSLRTFARLPFVREVIVVLPRAWVERVAQAYGDELRRLRVTMLVPGGARRQDSVRAGLALARWPLVLIHDAARPFVTARAIRKVAQAAARHGAAVLASPAVDTVKIVDSRGRVMETPDRGRVWHAQTPQGFRRKVLAAAYRRVGGADATDDAQLVERVGGCVVVVAGDGGNFKVTTPADLSKAENLLDRGGATAILGRNTSGRKGVEAGARLRTQS